MEKLVATISSFASAEEQTNLSNAVKDLDSHVNEIDNSLENLDSHVRHIHNSMVKFTSDHYVFHKEEKENYTEELNQVKHDIHNLRVALTWTLIGLICGGVSILGLCAHLLS